MAIFADALKTIKEAVVDFSQLDVRTFVGTMEVKVTGAGNPDWDTLMKSGVTSGKIKLAASTTLKIDGDADYFEDPEWIDDGLRAAHNNAVSAGSDAREAIINMMATQIKGLIKSP